MATDVPAATEVQSNGRDKPLDTIRELIPTLTTLEKLDLVALLTRSIRHVHEKVNQTREVDEEQVRRQHEDMLNFIGELEAEHAGSEVIQMTDRDQDRIIYGV